MRLHKFASDAEYLDCQRHRRRQRDPSVSINEVLRICDWLQTHGVSPRCRGICHGASLGNEVRLFRDTLPNSEVIGTDLIPLGSDVIEWDFRKPKPEWIGRFDFVYSNSLDHVRDPKATVKTWLGQVKPSGVVLVCWSRGHMVPSEFEMPRPGGDCFEARLDEYILMMERIGVIRDLIYCKTKVKPGRMVIVVGKQR